MSINKAGKELVIGYGVDAAEQTILHKFDNVDREILESVCIFKVLCLN